MEFWTPHNLKNVTSGQWLEPPAEGGHILGGISTDTRNINPGQVFLAIAGDNFDGHDYLGAAIEAGASMLIVMDKEKAKKAPLPGAGAVSCLVVTDSITALQALARAYRDVLKQTNTMVIGVTGSNGKTTTRHLIHTALSTTLKGTQSPKSFNNHLGVPLTILAASTDDDFVVSEIGSNFPGEIAFLAEIVRPDIGVITSVGTAHIGHFGTKEAIANEKASLLLHVQPDGLVVIPDEGAAFDDMFGPDDPDRKMAPATAVATVLETLPKTIEVAQLDEFVFGDQVAIVQPSDPIRGNLVFEVGESLEIRLPMLGAHNAYNALIAITVARYMNVPDEKIKEGLENVDAVPMRMEVKRFGEANDPLVLINDCYNANPDSMYEAINELINSPLPKPGGRRVAILGDMNELGDIAIECHNDLGQFILIDSWGSRNLPPGVGGSDIPFDEEPPTIHLVILIGELAMCTADVLVRGLPGMILDRFPRERVLMYSEWSDDLPEKLAKKLNLGDVVLLKASRGMQFERLIPAMEKRFGRAEPLTSDS